MVLRDVREHREAVAVRLLTVLAAVLVSACASTPPDPLADLGKDPSLTIT